MLKTKYNLYYLKRTYTGCLNIISLALYNYINNFFKILNINTHIKQTDTNIS